MSIIILLLLLSIVLLYLYIKKTRPTIIISLTTSPKRINHIEPVIKCMFEQIIQPDYIYINLPYVYKRTGEKFNTIPEFLKHKKIILNYVEDIGPATKIVPTLKQNFNDNTLIISIDDDIYYSKSMILLFLLYHKLYPSSVITSNTYISFGYNKFPPYTKGGLVAGYSGVGYPYKIIKEKNIGIKLENEIVFSPKVCYFSDDFMIGNVLLNNNINIIVFCHNCKISYTLKPLEFGLDNDALHKGGAIGKEEKGDIHYINYKSCAKYLNEQNKLNDKLKAFLDKK